MSPAANSSSRWCPTPEQLMILEEMYRTGTRTPNASQIQQITAHLSFYGKIEGKNVFYWFQNHKARDRQKLRRKLYKQLQQQQVLYHHHHHQHHQMMMMSRDNIQQNNHYFLGYNSGSTAESHVNNYSGNSATHFHHQQLSCYNSPSSAGSIPGQVQGTRVFEDNNHSPSTHNHNHHHHLNHQMMSYTWKMEIPAGADHQRLDQENSIMRSIYDCDWMTMLDMGPVLPNSQSSCNTNSKPLKTLQLFPITATNLKEECTTSSKLDDLDLSAN